MKLKKDVLVPAAIVALGLVVLLLYVSAHSFRPLSEHGHNPNNHHIH